MAVAKKPRESVISVTIPPINTKITKVVVYGTSELIVHAWSDKAIRQIKMKQAKATRTKTKEVRNPEAEYEAAFYRIGNKPAIKTIWFKKAMAATAATMVDGITKTFINKAVHVNGELTEVHGEPYMREDMVRLGGIGSPADVRYRPAFPTWWCELEFEYDESQISTEQVIALLNLAGYNNGVGELRPEKTGDGMGRFRVATDAEAKALKQGATKRRKR